MLATSEQTGFEGPVTSMQPQHHHPNTNLPYSEDDWSFVADLLGRQEASAAAAAVAAASPLRSEQQQMQYHHPFQSQHQQQEYERNPVQVSSMSIYEWESLRPNPRFSAERRPSSSSSDTSSTTNSSVINANRSKNSALLSTTSEKSEYTVAPNCANSYENRVLFDTIRYTGIPSPTGATAGVAVATAARTGSSAAQIMTASSGPSHYQTHFSQHQSPFSDQDPYSQLRLRHPHQQYSQPTANRHADALYPMSVQTEDSSRSRNNHMFARRSSSPNKRKALNEDEDEGHLHGHDAYVVYAKESSVQAEGGHQTSLPARSTSTGAMSRISKKRRSLDHMDLDAGDVGSEAPSETSYTSADDPVRYPGRTPTQATMPHSTDTTPTIANAQARKPVDRNKKPWEEKEERMILYVVYYFVEKDLKTISQIAQRCDIDRSIRAIDKKLKRLLNFEKWNSRVQTEIQSNIRTIFRDRNITFTKVQRDKLAQAKREFAAANYPPLPCDEDAAHMASSIGGTMSGSASDIKTKPHYPPATW